MHRLSAGTALTLSLLFLGGSAFGQAATSPAALTTMEGDTNSRFPFDPDVLQNPVEMRYQQVFDAVDFDHVSPPVEISELRFRADAGQVGQNGLTGTLQDLEIRISTTSRDPDGLSTTFSQNIGGNEQLVFDGSVGFFPVPSTPPGPAPFFISIPLQSSFFYDWRNGNLLLDLRNRSDGVSGAVDAELQDGDTVSRAFSFDAEASTAETVDTLGLVVRFVPDPAPASAAAAATACLASLAARRRRA